MKEWKIKKSNRYPLFYIPSEKKVILALGKSLFFISYRFVYLNYCFQIINFQILLALSLGGGWLLLLTGWAVKISLGGRAGELRRYLETRLAGQRARAIYFHKANNLLCILLCILLLNLLFTILENNDNGNDV